MADWKVGDTVLAKRHFFDTGVNKDMRGVVTRARWASIDVRFEIRDGKYEEVKEISHKDVY